ncbi:MAG: hypothetical protein WA820_23960 [Bradyrhizobium sp.]
MPLCALTTLTSTYRATKSLRHLSAEIPDRLSAPTETSLSACARKFPNAPHFGPEPENFKQTWRLIEVGPWHFWKTQDAWRAGLPDFMRIQKIQISFVRKKVVFVWKAGSYGKLARMESVLTGDLNTRHAPHLQATTSADFFASKEVQAKRCKQRGAFDACRIRPAYCAARVRAIVILQRLDAAGHLPPLAAITVAPASPAPKP